uniref:Uncharacterized protein MANES_05G204900 n=1 Tax=Rhizophora mucronata TaxID=61149 RepID=A0A2P2KT89_RHIMU
MNNIIAREGGGRRGEKMRTLLVLLTNLWECLLLRNRPPGNSSCFSKTHHHHSASSSSSSLVIPIPPPPSYLGAFDRISIDVLMHILWLLGPKDAARLALVSKSWRSIVSDNRLWFHFLRQTLPDSDSLFFAETHLRSGYPLQTFSSHTVTELLFMRIYAQRSQVPGSIIIDGGSGYCKYGWSKYGCPTGCSATFLEFGNIESPMYSRLRHFFATIYSRMQVKASAHPVVVSLPICHYDDTESAKASRRQLKEAMYTALFDMNVPAVCAINQATLALYAARQTSGIAVNIGFQVTSIVPSK